MPPTDPQPKFPFRLTIGIVLTVLLAGGGGIYAMIRVGEATRVEAAPATIIAFVDSTPLISTPTPVFQPPTESFVAPLPLASPTETPITHLAPPTDEPATSTPTLTATATLTPSRTPTPTRTPTATASPTPTATLTPTDVPRPLGLPKNYLPGVSANARDIYLRGLALGNNPRVFSRLGDCHSSYPGFLGLFDTPTAYRLGDYAYLREVIDHYSGSFSHPSQTAYSGLNMGSFFSAVWADPKVCLGGENVMECEYRVRRPSLIFINIGTLNKDSSDEQFEQYVRPIIDFWISRGVLPILNTKADNLEGSGRFNAITRRLAAEYDIPLWDFWFAAQALPNSGLADDQVHLYDGQPYFDDPNQLMNGWTMRNLTGLQALDVVWRALK